MTAWAHVLENVLRADEVDYFIEPNEVRTRECIGRWLGAIWTSSAKPYGQAISLAVGASFEPDSVVHTDPSWRKPFADATEFDEQFEDALARAARGMVFYEHQLWVKAKAGPTHPAAPPAAGGD